MSGLYIDILAKVVTKLSTYIIEHQYIVCFCHVLSTMDLNLFCFKAIEFSNKGHKECTKYSKIMQWMIDFSVLGASLVFFVVKMTSESFRNRASPHL